MLTSKSERSSNGRHDLTDQTVQIGVSWSLNVQILLADIINCFVVKEKTASGMLKCRVSGMDSVVWLDYCSANLRSGVDCEL